MKYIAGSGELELFLPYLPFHSGSLPPAVDGDPVRDELAAIRQYDQDNLAFLVSHPSSDAMALVGEAFTYREGSCLLLMCLREEQGVPNIIFSLMASAQKHTVQFQHLHLIGQPPWKLWYLMILI